jgi:hypothetical protein
MLRMNWASTVAVAISTDLVERSDGIAFLPATDAGEEIRRRQ